MTQAEALFLALWTEVASDRPYDKAKWIALQRELESLPGFLERLPWAGKPIPCAR